MRGPLYYKYSLAIFRSCSTALVITRGGDYGLEENFCKSLDRHIDLFRMLPRRDE